MSQEPEVLKPEKSEIIDLIIKESRHRPIVPFVGSGISFSAGFPTISPVIQYLAKVDFAIRFGIYRERFPPFDGANGKKSLVERYRNYPSQFIRDFGWPNFGGLDAELWAWLKREQEQGYPNIKIVGKHEEITDSLNELETRDHLLVLIQWVLRREQEQRDEGTEEGIKEGWQRWKEWYSSGKGDKGPKLLYGDWEMLLDKLCEGDFGLVDRLFTELERGLYPSQAHRLLALLQPKLGIPLVLTTNFDSLLERAFQEEGLTPKVFDIHRDSELPDPGLVKRQLSILKLHGSAYGLRVGERLRQKLESDACDYVKHYLPKNALILVLGFSGSERRMMQVLQAFLESDIIECDNPRLLWIQGPGSPGLLFNELVDNDNGKVSGCYVKHADTFLQELYFKLASSHQSSTKGYLSQSTQYLTEWKFELPQERKKNDLVSIFKRENPLKLRRCPLQVFVADQPDELSESSATGVVTDQHKEKIVNLSSGSWATLAGMAFTQSLHQSYRIIWIDLENHGTVESIIAEFFSRVKTIDPKSPSFNFSLINFKQGHKQNRIMEKAVDRICDAFQRGKFVLVLDSLESFGRPPMVHHGIPNIRGALLNDFKKQTNLLQDFFAALINKSNDLKDSYVIVTIDKPRQRHAKNSSELSESTNEAYSDLENTVKKLIDDFKKADKENKNVRIYPQNNQKYSAFCPDNNSSLKELTQVSLIENLHNDWNYYKSGSSSSNRAKHVLSLIELLRVKNCEKLSADDYKGAISAFIGFLAFFRRPRSIPLRRASVDRWLLRKILDHQLEEKDADNTHFVIEHLLNLVTGAKINSKFTGQEERIVNFLLKAEENKELDIGIIAQRLEGGSIWLFREAHEATYNAITEHLHVQEWIGREEDLGIDLVSHCSRKIDAILDGMTCVSWHMHAARTYYVDIFLPTRDIKVFYEYLYHRVSALRIITLLIAIVSSFSNKLENEGGFKDVINEFNSLKNKSNIKSNLGSDFYNSFIWYVDVIGVFAEDPKYKSKDYIGISEDVHDFLLKRLVSLRENALETLLMALKRNDSLFRASSVPEIVVSWAKQFLERELPEIIGEVFDKEKLSNIYKACKTDSDDKTVQQLKDYFQELEYLAQISKFDFDEYIKKDFNDFRNNVNELIDGMDEYESIKIVLEEVLLKYNPGLKEPFFCKNIINEKLNAFGDANGKQTVYSIEELELQLERRIELLDIFLLISTTNNAEMQRKQSIRLLRCLVYQSPNEATKFADSLLSTYDDKSKSSNSNNEVTLQLKKLRHDIHGLKAKSILASRSIWKPLRDRDLYIDENQEGLKIAEDAAIAYEDSLRIICETREEEARHRSNAFSIRARTLYLRDHFRVAHQFLDLASSGLQMEHFEHRSNAAIIHIVRAELLAISADSHFRKKLKEINSGNIVTGTPLSAIKEVNDSLNKIEQAVLEIHDGKISEAQKSVLDREINISLNNIELAVHKLDGDQSVSEIQDSALIEEVNASLKKIERAEQELTLGDDLLGNTFHLRSWLVFLEFGRAQLSLERMLFEMENLFLTWPKLDDTQYLQKSGELELSILDSMGRLRKVLDLIPFRNDFWEDKDNKKSYPLLVEVERMCYGLWSDLFIAGAYFNGLLNKLHEPPQLIYDINHNSKIDAIIGAIVNQENEEHYLKRWKHWSLSMRFRKMSKSVSLIFILNPENKDMRMEYAQFAGKSLREKIIVDMKSASKPEQIRKIWNDRREDRKNDDRRGPHAS